MYWHAFCLIIPQAAERSAVTKDVLAQSRIGAGNNPAANLDYDQKGEYHENEIVGYVG